MATLGPKMITDANRRLAWVPTLANYHAPTVAEITAGVDISCLVTAANFALGATGDASINEPPLCSDSETSDPGRTTFELAMNFYRFKSDVDDIAWTTFTGKGIHGYLVSRIGQIPDGTRAHEVPWTASDEVQVYEAITNTPQIMAPEGSTYEKFRQVFGSQQQIDERAVIAAATV